MRILACPNVLVGEQGKVSVTLRRPDASGGQRRLGHPRGLWSHVRVEARLREIEVAGPEAECDRLLSLGLVSGRGVGPRQVAGEDEIEAVPEEEDRTCLDDRPAGELAEGRVAEPQRLGESCDVGRVIGPRGEILGERCRVGKAIRDGSDGGPNSIRGQHLGEPAVDGRD